MSFWLVPALAVWIVVLVLLGFRVFPILGHRLLDLLYGAGTKAEATIKAMMWPKDARREYVRVMSMRYVTAFGGFAGVVLVVGVAASMIMNLVGTVILMIVPGALIGASVYRRILQGRW